MDKETLSNYGWIVICVLVMVVMIALATPFGSYISSAVKSTTEGLFDVNKEALNSTGLIDVEDQSISIPYDDVNTPEDNTPSGVGGIIDGVKDFIEDNKDEIKDVVDDAKDFIEDNKDEIKEGIDDVKDKVDDKIEEITGGATCGMIEHAHEDACYLKTCDHKNGHISTCYETVIGYNLCEHTDDTEHTGSVTLADVVTIKGTNVTWIKDHPAYNVVYSVYKAAYDKAYAEAKYMKSVAGKAAGVVALLDKKFCYTAVESTEPTLCTHGECTDTSGTCYTKTCVIPEHTHDEVECFKPKN